LHLVDSMGSQAAIKFAAEKHFGVFDPVVSRPRWRVFPNMEREPVFAVNPFDQSPADACVFYHMVDGVDHVHVGWSDVRFSLGCFGPRNDDTVKAAGLFLECLRGTVPGKPGAPVVTDREGTAEEVRRWLQKHHGYSHENAVRIIAAHVDDGELIDIWDSFPKSVISYKVAK